MLAVLLVIALASACGADDPVAPEIARPDGFELEIVVDDLEGPTQLFVEDDGTYVLGQLAGAENEGLGQVIQIDPDSGERAVLYEGLDKPTGVLVRNDEVWVMESDQLSRGPRSGGSLTIVADDLPNNGRSEGTLTLTPEGDVLYNTSGRKRGATVTEGSGRIFTIGDDGVAVELASGFKHAYAHVFDADGTLWATEMSDGRFDDQPALDELVAVTPGADHGWPRCVGNNRVVIEFGGTPELCDEVPGSTATFAAGATPTSVVVSPFDPDVLLVALWSRGEVVSVPRINDGGLREATPFLTGLLGPQHMVALDDELLLVEFSENRILSIRMG